MFKAGIIKNIVGKFNFKTNLLGNHNILNATSAIIASLIAGVPLSAIYESLKNFEGVKRRFTFLGKMNKASIYDDYAHHPSEIRASYEIAKQISQKKIIVIFQPHRYSRTSILLNDFIKILKKIDVLYILDIYSAGEKPIKNINSKILTKKLIRKNKDVFYLNNINNFEEVLKKYFADDNTIIFMGAGSITYMANDLMKKSEKYN